MTIKRNKQINVLKLFINSNYVERYNFAREKMTNVCMYVCTYLRYLDRLAQFSSKMV